MNALTLITGLFSALVLWPAVLPVTAQTSTIDGNEYAFRFSGFSNSVPKTGFGLYFNQNNPAPAGYEFLGSTGSPLFTIGATTGDVRATGNILCDGNINPGGALQVDGNQYAFQFAANGNFGLYFNQSLSQYEFRNGSANPVFSINANSGDLRAYGKVGIGTSNPIAALHITPNSSAFALRIDQASPSGHGMLVYTNTTSSSQTIFQASSNVVGMSIKGNGRVGIGTTNPTARLHVANGETHLEGHTYLLSGGSIYDDLYMVSDQKSIIFKNTSGPNKPMMELFQIGTQNADRMVFAHSSTYDNWGLQYRDSEDSWHFLENGVSRMTIGSESIGTGYYLTVDGKILCEELRVELSGNWPDYVFSEEYDLMPLEELKQRIEANGHLPGVPSADEIEGGGLEIGEMQKVVMEKIEELTLYVIELKEENNALRELIHNSGR